MQLADVLSVKGTEVFHTTSDATLAEATNLLHRHRVGALVVLDHGALVGILSERDVMTGLATMGTAVMGDAVAAHMTSPVVTRRSTSGINSVMELMTEARVRHIPVVDDGVLLGVVSIGDLVRSRIEELEGARRELLDYVGAR